MALLTWVTLGLYALSCKAASTFDLWSFANQVGAYQWYIHGTQNTSHYLALSPSFKNPADTSETNGLKLTIDTTSTWNSQFERSELIPQTAPNSGNVLGTGNLFYHFSIAHPSTNLPDQICFFESHFTELKYGCRSHPTHLTWMIQGVGHWDIPFDANTWFNFAYDINFSAGTVGLWASTGSNPLVKVVQNIATSTSTNSADWHLGVLRLINGGGPEDWYFSGVYIENGPITTSVGTGTGTGKWKHYIDHHIHLVNSFVDEHDHEHDLHGEWADPRHNLASAEATEYTGPTVCQSPFTCKAISPPFYYQCL
ncbi:hypothetical protein B0H14DRAFT_3906788 [Mycena olivaceomarginata]|nr:hypothetical protein B0H14DRAFT_3906788 [Mycena olivaceomarginata]